MLSALKTVGEKMGEVNWELGEFQKYLYLFGWANELVFISYPTFLNFNCFPYLKRPLSIVPLFKLHSRQQITTLSALCPASFSILSSVHWRLERTFS